MQVFGRLLSSNFFECLQASLVCQQVSLPVFYKGVSLILVEVIASITYLASWALVTPIIASRLLLDSRPFLLEVIGATSLGLFPFQAYLKLV